MNDAENRLVEVKKNSITIAQFTFDGNGKRVMSVMDGETILFVGAHFEMKDSEITKYYFAGASRIAIRKYTTPQSMTVEYLLGDHLGSTSITTDANGVKISELRYKPWGETRYEWTGAPVTTPTYELTRYQYTGQYSDSYIKLLFYGSRHYDTELGRFIQPDSIIPDPNNPQAWDRYAYTFNNPVKYVDPNGHFPWIPVITAIVVVVVVVAIGVAVDTAMRGHAMNASPICADTYATCFENRERLNISEGKNLDEKQFDDMLNSIHDDLEGGWRTPIDPGRSAYDTPFWNGNPRFGDPIYPDETVCLGDKCSQRSAVNYVGQGMYSARTGQSLGMAQFTVSAWNYLVWGHGASPDELHWMEYGYNAYNEIEEEETGDGTAQ